jgi:hypothetical protein
VVAVDRPTVVPEVVVAGRAQDRVRTMTMTVTMTMAVVIDVLVAVVDLAKVVEVTAASFPWAELAAGVVDLAEAAVRTKIGKEYGWPVLTCLQLHRSKKNPCLN